MKSRAKGKTESNASWIDPLAAMEIEMAASTQAAGKEMSAGLYLRVKTRIRSLGWSWSKKGSANLLEAETQRPWSGLAEWLRIAHSLLDEKDVKLTRNADQSSPVRAIEQRL